MTKQEYAANVARRFGNGNLPSWADLAKLENRAMRKVAGLREQRAVSSIHSSEASPRVQALREAFDARKAARAAAILDYLSDFRTSGNVATRMKVCIRTARETLRGMKADGLVTMSRVRCTAVWKRAEEEPHPQANPVTVRGKVFPSMSACARHFGITIQAVRSAVERGTTDNIGTRKEAVE